jgi:Mg2+/Co2+ transporter CorC
MDDDTKTQMSELTKGYVYCDLMLTSAEATALEQLVKALRASGQHQVLDRVFNDVLEEIEQGRDHSGVDQAWPTI